MALILQLCPDFYVTGLYKNLFSSLQDKRVKQVIYVHSPNLGYTGNLQVENLGINFSLIERALFFGKQRVVVNDIVSKNFFNEISFIHAHTLFSSGYTALQLYKRFGIPYIVAVRNTDVNIVMKYAVHLRRVGIEIMNNARNVIFISPAYKENVISNHVHHEIRKSIEDKSFVVPNGIDAFFFENICHKKKLSGSLKEKRIHIIYFGEITKNKNIETTIKACTHLIHSGYSVRFKIIGEVKYKSFFNSIYDHDFINYIPKCSKEELILHMNDSDVFVMPSKYETFGLVYPEALSQGIPIIYTKGQGFDGFFSQGVVGYAVSCYDSTAIADGIMNIYDNYKEISNNCINGVSQFNWNDIASEYINIYRNN